MVIGKAKEVFPQGLSLKKKTHFREKMIPIVGRNCMVCEFFPVCIFRPGQ
jgi:hypothetical protein